MEVAGSDIDHWLLLRGLARESRHWGAFPDQLRAAFPKAKVHVLDLPGAGTETARNSPLTIEGIASDLRARWKPISRHNRGRWGLFTVSLGGMAGFEWVASHPKDFTRLIAVNTSAADVAYPWERLRPQVMPHLLRLPTVRDFVDREATVLRLTTRLLPDVVPLAKEWAALDVKPRVATFLSQLAAAAAFRLPRLPKNFPVLLLASACDGFTDPVCSRRIAHRLNSPLREHPSAGHDLMLDDPQWVIDRIREWTACSSV